MPEGARAETAITDARPADAACQDEKPDCANKQVNSKENHGVEAPAIMKRRFRKNEDGVEDDADADNKSSMRKSKEHIPGNLRVQAGDTELLKIAKAISYKLCLKYWQDLRTLSIVAFFFYLQYIRWTKWGTMDDNPILEYGLFVLHSVFGFFCATIVHNCVHVHMFTYQWMNTMWQIILSHTYGYPVSVLIPGHNLSHHRYTQTEYDIHYTQKMKYKWHLLNFFAFWIKSLPAALESDPRYFREARERGETLMNFRVTVEQLCFWPVQLLVCYFSFHKWLWIFFIPQLYAKWCLVSINMYQHDGCAEPDAEPNAKDGTDRWPPLYNSSRDFTGTILNLFTCNNGYHSIHHLRPSCHWSRYPDLWKEIVVPHQHPNLRQKCICWYVIKTFWLPSWIPGCGRRWFDGREYFPDDDTCGIGHNPKAYVCWVSRHFSEIAKGTFMD